MKTLGIAFPTLLTSLFFFSSPSAFAANETVVVVEAQYAMADGDTLAVAETQVMQRAQRRAVEKAGLYLEATFYDFEKESRGQSTHTRSLEIRTIAAAITKTDILESRRSFEHDRPLFYLRIRATVDLESLTQAIKRLQSEAQLTRHFRQLQQENRQLRTRLRDLQQQPIGVRMLVIGSDGRAEPALQAEKLLTDALHTRDLAERIRMVSEATSLDNSSAKPLIMRGQIYLRLASIARAGGDQWQNYNTHVENAQADFDRAIQLDRNSSWAWLGKGDVQTWLRRMDEATASYEQALLLDPLFDIARQRLIDLSTTQARRLARQERWEQALTTLNRLLDEPVPESWIPEQKEAYLLRSIVFQKLNRTDQALSDLSTVIRVDPRNAEALANRAAIYRNRLQGGSARNDFEQACLLGSNSACEHLP